MVVACQREGRTVNELIIHESVTRSAISTVAVLQRRKLGVHLIVAPDGRVTQHGDLAHERLAHAGGHQRRPGVYAHHYFGHADGAWLILYAWLRLEVGLPPCVAYEEAVARATGARRTIDVSDLLPSEPNA